MDSLLIDNRGYFWPAGMKIPPGYVGVPRSTAGTLQVRTDGQISLSLDGILPRARPGGAFADAFTNTPLGYAVCGFLIEKNRYVRLTGLRPNGSRFGPIATEAMSADSCLVSEIPLNGRSEPKFAHIRFSLAGYEDWLWLHSIRIQRTKRSFKAAYSRPAPLKWRLSDGALKIEFDLFGPGQGERFSLSAEERVSLTYSPGATFDWERVPETCSRFDDLLVLLTDSENGLDFPSLRSRSGKHWSKLYYPRIERRKSPVDLSWCWTSFRALKDRFGDVVEAWLRCYETLGPGVHLYMSNRRGLRLYPEHRFVNFIWGLESLHRRQAQRENNPKLEQKIERIVEQIVTARDKRWAGCKLRRSLEPNLAARLHDIFSSLPIEFPKAELRDFSDRCAALRNDISHFGGERTPGDYRAFVDRIQQLNIVLDLLFHAKLLQEAGLPDDQMLAFFRGAHAYGLLRAFQDTGLNPPSLVEAVGEAPLEPSQRERPNVT